MTHHLILGLCLVVGACATALLTVGCTSSDETSTGFTTPGTRPVMTTSLPVTGESSSIASSPTDSGSGSSSPTDSGSDSSGAVESSAGGSSSGGLAWDVGASDDFGDSIGCKGKIDFLFVISGSWHGFWYQDALYATYPAFMAAIAAEFPDLDGHILVADGDELYQMSDCSWCTDPEDCDPSSMDKSCGIPFDICDRTLGAGITFPIGAHASNHRCDLVDGHRYITNADTDPLASFECIATVGNGEGERVAEAMVAAIGDELNGPTGCNEGFVRDDALLVVTLIKPYDDWASQGEPDDWIEALYTSKGGNEDAVFALVFADSQFFPPKVPPDCNEFFPGRLRAFAEGVKHGTYASICTSSKASVFLDSVAAIKPLCDALIPQ